MKPVVIFEKMGFYDASVVHKVKKTHLRETQLYEIEVDVTDDGVSYVDGVGYSHKMGNILVCRPGMKRQSLQPYRCHYIHFECVDREFEEKYLKKLPVCMYTADVERFRALLVQIAECLATDGKENPLYATTAFLNLVCALNRLHEQQQCIDSKYLNLRRNVYAAQQYILKHYAEKLLLDRLAAEAHLSPNYFLTVFKNVVGKTPNKYITEVRLNEAKKRLVNTLTGMDEIAEQCGFESQAYMCYVFKKELHISPKAYRDLYRVVL